MPLFTFRLPDIGEGIAEAEIVAWHVNVGDAVHEDQAIADMMTDKATVEMESPVAGVVMELAGVIGDRVAIGAALMVVETAAKTEQNAELSIVPTESEQPRTIERTLETVPELSVQPVQSASVKEARLGPIQANEEIVAPAHHTSALASPAVRARAKDLGIDLKSVKAGESGRIRHADLDVFLRYNAQQGYHALSQTRADETIKIIGMRRRISENMQASKRHIPHFTYVEEIDVTALEGMRTELNANRGINPKLTLLPLLITALCRVMPEFPMINARFDDEAGVVTRYGAVQLGMATQTDAGLMVPVIRDAQSRNIWQLAAEIVRLAEAARNGSARASELSGSTLTVTSLGPLGGIATTPIINRPEVAIIGPNRIIERPVYDGDVIRRAKLMNLSISCDHRVVDGWDAASFIQAVKKLLETPVLLFAPQ